MKMPSVASTAPMVPEQVADERRRREHRHRSHLADRDGVPAMRFGQPDAAARRNRCAERPEDVAAARTAPSRSWRRPGRRAQAERTDRDLRSRSSDDAPDAEMPPTSAEGAIVAGNDGADRPAKLRQSSSFTPQRSAPTRPSRLPEQRFFAASAPTRAALAPRSRSSPSLTPYSRARASARS